MTVNLSDFGEPAPLLESSNSAVICLGDFLGDFLVACPLLALGVLEIDLGLGAGLGLGGGGHGSSSAPEVSESSLFVNIFLTGGSASGLTEGLALLLRLPSLKIMNTD